MPYMPNGPQFGLPSQQLPPGWAPPSLPVPSSRLAAPAPAPPAPLLLPPPPANLLASTAIKPKVRAVSEDPPARLVLPSPEALGIAVAPPAPVAVDWNHVHARLERLGVLKLERERLAQGGFRVVLALPTQQVEATGMSEAAAVLVALERAEKLAPVR